MNDEKKESEIPPGEPNAKSGKKKSKKAAKRKSSASKRTRKPRIYPALSFEESLVLADAIHTYASGERVARLTLLQQMNLSPTSSSTQILITSSGKYGITKGSYASEHLELTAEGRTATERATPPRLKAQARFDLAVKNQPPFQALYARYKGKKLPSHDVMRDTLREAKLDISDEKECIDTFIVNAKFLGLLQTIAGSETLIPIETFLEQLPSTDVDYIPPSPQAVGDTLPAAPAVKGASKAPNWQRICFYVTPIGDEGSEHRKHSDLFLLTD